MKTRKSRQIKFLYVNFYSGWRKYQKQEKLNNYSMSSIFLAGQIGLDSLQRETIS